MDVDTRLKLKTKMVGAEIRAAREDSGKSIKSAADLIGISSSTMSSYEHGRKGISLPELELLAYWLDIPVANLLDGLPSAPERTVHFDPKVVVSFRQKMIGALLRKHRIASEMTIGELAEKVGFPASRISAYERGTRQIPIPYLEVVVDALGKSMDEYIDTEGQGPIAGWYRERRAYETFRSLPPDFRDFLAAPENSGFVRAAMRLRDIPPDKLQSLSESLATLTS
ncbi:MAG: helix-turn-helix domain-containing protein [Anaerolineales bacterium]